MAYYWIGTTIRQRWWQRLLMRIATPRPVREAWARQEAQRIAAACRPLPKQHVQYYHAPDCACPIHDPTWANRVRDAHQYLRGHGYLPTAEEVALKWADEYNTSRSLGLTTAIFRAIHEYTEGPPMPELIR